jgi:Zn-dependent alcohol dehydrogenase
MRLMSKYDLSRIHFKAKCEERCLICLDTKDALCQQQEEKREIRGR